LPAQAAAHDRPRICNNSTAMSLLSRLSPLLLAATLLTGAGLVSSPARAALFGDDEARKAILDLRGRLAEQDKRAQENQAALNQRLDAAQRSQLELVNQIEGLRQEIARLRGQNDTLANELANLQKRNRDLYGDLDTRLKSLEPVQVTIDGKPVSMGRDEQGAYDAALAVFRGGDFAGAVRAFQGFLLRYPASAHAASARYWTGSALYAQKDYRNAIAEQQIVVDKHPASPRAPEALLNIAASQDELKQRPAARATLQKLIKDYPDTESARLARERLAAMGSK
jgi:tol-pal system protein YbgF